MNTNKEITITKDQFVRTAAEVTQEAMENTKEPAVVIAVALITALLAKKLFHGGVRLMAMWRLSNDRRCTC